MSANAAASALRQIGIVACSAEGAALCYCTICSEGAALLGDHAHPDVSMHSPSFARYRERIERDDWRVGILGTRWLVSSSVYPDRLSALGIEYERPAPQERDEIHRIIMQELVYGRFEPESIAYFQRVIERMKRSGCDAVVLGCTEIPLIVGDSNSALPTLDSTRLLARAALRDAMASAAAR